MKTFTIELDDYDIHTIAYTIHQARQDDEYLQRAIKATITKISKQIKKQLEKD